MQFDRRAAARPALSFAAISARYPRLAGDLRGGYVSALVGLPYAVSSAILVFAPLGPQYIGHGMLAGVVTALVAGLVTAFIGGTPCQINGPRASSAVLMGSMVAIAAAHPALGGTDTSLVLGIVLIALMLVGLLQLGFGLLRMGGVVRFLPYPVISGFMVGLGVLIAGPQIPALFGMLKPNDWGSLLHPGAIQLGALTVGGVTIAALAYVRLRLPRWPAPVAGLLAGTAAHFLLVALAGAGVGATAWDMLPGHALPPMPWQAPSLAFDPSVFAVLTDLLPAIATLAFVASLETLLSSSAISVVSSLRYNSRRELIGQGLSNMAVAAFGGVISSGAPFRSLANFKAGGRTGLSSAVNGLLIGGTGLAAAPLLFHVPLAAWAGVLAVVGFDVMRDWAKRLAGNPRADIGVGFVVMFVTLALGTVPAILVGIAGSVLLYVHNTSRAPIRGHYSGAVRSSLRVRPEAQMLYLREHGAGTRVVELQGPLFFGTADRCGRELEAIAQGCGQLIIDLGRVSEVDTTGAVVLMQTVRRITEHGARVALAAVTRGGRRGRVLGLAGVSRIIPDSAWFPDLDAALEHAENLLLAARWPQLAQPQELDVAQLDVCHGMSREELEGFTRFLAREDHPGGATLFREGEPGDRMYLIARGAVTVRLRLLRKKGRMRRLATYSPGVIVGEMAVLEGKPRSADGVCEGDTRVYVLTGAALQAMAREAPALHGRFLFNLSRQVAARLRATTFELRASLD